MANAEGRLFQLQRRRVSRAALLAMLAACSPRGNAPAGLAVGTPLRLGIDLWAGYYPLLLAEQHGLLAKAGIRAIINLPQNTRQLLSAFAAGELDGVFASLGDMITLTRDAPDLRMILACDESAGGDVILGRLAPADGAALRGARIGTTLGGFGEMLILRFVARYGIGFGEIKLVQADASEIERGLLEGRLDYGHSWEPYASRARRNGLIEVFSSRETPGLIVDGLVMRGEFMERQGATVRALLQQWFAARDHWLAQPKEDDALLLQRLQGKTDDVSLEGIRLLDLAENRRKFEPGETDQSLHHVAQQYVDHFVRRALLIHRPSPAALIDGRFLP